MQTILKAMQQLKLIPVLVLDNEKDAFPVAQALNNGGLPCVEITFRTAAAPESIRIISKSFPNMLVGAGTVLSKEQVDCAIDAGAKFIVTPGFNPNIVSYCIQKNIPIIPGVSCASDIEAALELGLNVVKLFPAQACGGIEMIKALSAPYSNVKFMPTGGITLENLQAYLSNPNVLACGGSWMVNRELINNKEFDKIETITKQSVAAANLDIALSAKEQLTKNSTTAVKPSGTKKKVVTFGELMLRLAPPEYERFVQCSTFESTYGGGEANVAVSLANYSFDSYFVSKLPNHEIGQAAINSLRTYGVNTSYIIRGGERIGIYYLEKGASQRPSKVIYDRAHSAISTSDITEYDWETIFQNASWFHFTGITPALSKNIASICIEACKTAKKLGITISCDLNYRNKLWTKQEAQHTMSQLCQYVDVLIANEEDAFDVFGIQAQSTDIALGIVNKEGYKDVAKQLTQRFPFKKVAITLRESHSANDNNWSAMLYDGNEYYFSREYPIHIVDRVGGGDSFAGGLISALLDNEENQSAIDFAVAASCLKHSIKGDYNLVSKDEIKRLAHGDASGRVQR